MNESTDFINSVNLNADTDFPYLVLDVINDRSYPLNPGFRVMHWHKDLQFVLLLSGSIEIKTFDMELVLQAGEAVFINRNVIHLITPKALVTITALSFPTIF